MKSYLNSVFQREQVTTTTDVIRWWNKGRLLLNLFLLIVTIIHILIIVVVIRNGWVFFLLPAIVTIWVIINLLFSVGLLFELISKKYFKSKIDFNESAPTIKAAEFVVLIAIVLIISIWHLSSQ